MSNEDTASNGGSPPAVRCAVSRRPSSASCIDAPSRARSCPATAHASRSPDPEVSASPTASNRCGNPNRASRVRDLTPGPVAEIRRTRAAKFFTAYPSLVVLLTGVTWLIRAHDADQTTVLGFFAFRARTGPRGLESPVPGTRVRRASGAST
ncbi:hypothetical protein NOCA1250002 [metagenome]|uniref:Uncharacterized protein n=1 Tax=metagenome TaxID=256318 RepID=A0A2P2CHI2_9ZZZZ